MYIRLLAYQGEVSYVSDAEVFCGYVHEYIVRQHYLVKLGTTVGGTHDGSAVMMSETILTVLDRMMAFKSLHTRLW